MSKTDRFKQSGLNKTEVSNSLLSGANGQYDNRGFPVGNDGDIPSPKTATRLPMSPLAASVTVVNLVLATGPFSYPYQFAALGPIMSLTLLFVTAFISYITSTYIVEAISSANALGSMAGSRESLFPDQVYATPVLQKRLNKKDTDHK